MRDLVASLARHTLSALKDRDLRWRYARAWWHALRAFSLVIAFNSCALGTLLAWLDGHRDALAAALVVVAGVLLQAGVNLVNDFFEFKQRNLADKVPALAIFGAERDYLEWVIFFTGLLCFAAAALLGLFLVWRLGAAGSGGGWGLLALGAVGLAGGYFYTGEPFNYKRRGLGVPFVFVLMGPMMIAGSYLALAGVLRPPVLWIGIPLSALIAHILLCNEIRDYEYDREHGLRTLSSRIGMRRATLLSYLLLAVGYLGPVILHLAGLFPHLGFVFLALPFAVRPMRTMRSPPAKRSVIIPAIMLHHLVYGLAFMLTYVWSPF